MNLFKEIFSFFFNGGIFMYPLLLCSVLLVAAVIFRLLNVRTSRIAPPGLIGLIERCLTGEESLETLRSAVEYGRSPLARLVAGVLESETDDEEALLKITEIRAREEFTRLQVAMPLIDMIVMISPMFGILGTATGLVIVFSSFGMDDNQGEIARGIANALNTTITGLAIATPAVIASVCFSRQLEKASAGMEVLLSELISLRCRQGGGTSTEKA